MNAEQAESLASKVRDRPIFEPQVTINRLLRRIERASRAGKYSTWIYCDKRVLLHVKHEMRKRGFGCESGLNFFCMDWVMVNW